MTFDEFLLAFFDIFQRKGFPGGSFHAYLDKTMTGDEAPIVDKAVVGPLLNLLGFDDAEQVYNEQKQGDRPDFAPSDSAYGTCFFVEDKATGLDLTLDLTNPDSHLSQLSRYVRAGGARSGWLTNGRRLIAWRFDDPTNPTRILDLDVAAALRAWRPDDPASLPDAPRAALQTLFDLFRKSSFTDPQRLERELAVDLDQWRRQALPVGAGTGSEEVLVGVLQALVRDLQADARRILQERLEGHRLYRHQSERLDDDAPERAADTLDGLIEKVTLTLAPFRAAYGLTDQDIDQARAHLLALKLDPRAFGTVKALQEALLEILNEAKRRKYAATNDRAARRSATLDEAAGLRDLLQHYGETAFVWHQRRAGLRHKHRLDLAVQTDYEVWTSLVQETMLGDLNEDQRRDEFALQAAYVVFIRLLLIRVCEDKGIFPDRFLTDGGIKHWQEDIRRYLKFARGNRYEPLLDMAYRNAQNIYAHFFTGRELFNWYELSEDRLILTLHQLSRFDFAQADSDIVGTVYSTYVSRPEKKKKGQYYTPPSIVDAILDEVGYVSGPAIIGTSKRLIDPACGSGTFLVRAARRLVETYAAQAVTDPASVLEQVKDGLYGFDLNPFACYLAEVNVLIQVLDLVKAAFDAGQDVRLDRFHIYNVDALARPAGMFYGAQFGAEGDENDLVEQIKRRAPGSRFASGFAFVVANPPYGAKLTDSYKEMLRAEYAEVFQGQPDTYVFFFQLALRLLARNGRIGFITPNTYLMGTNTSLLRERLLAAGRIERIVDLPQGIWPDATVDCVLLFLAGEESEAARLAQSVQVNLMGMRDDLGKLTARAWDESLVQSQAAWMKSARHEMNIRYTPLLQQIEDACRVPIGVGNGTKVQRLGDVTDSSQGIIPYIEAKEGKANRYIKPRNLVPQDQDNWKPLLDGSAYVGRYGLRWGSERPYLQYGKFLGRPREAKYFESEKLLVQDMRNRSLARRLVSTYDDKKFYNRHNFSNVIAMGKAVNLKYILALFNSSLLNYWFARQFDNVHINPSYFRELPIYPADAETQAVFVGLVDRLLALNADLNALRDQEYIIKTHRDGRRDIQIPYDRLLRDLQTADPDFPVLTLFQAQAANLFVLGPQGAGAVQIGTNVHVSDKRPTLLVLRNNRAALDIPGDDLRRYLTVYLRRPQWQGRSFDEIKTTAIVPEDAAALARLFTLEAKTRAEIERILDEIARLDADIDERVLNSYGITDAADRRRILGSAPTDDETDGEDAEVEEAP